MSDSTTKHCPKCDQDLPLDSFHKNRNRYDGREPYCKACRSIRKTPIRVCAVGMKYCYKCDHDLPLDAFPKNRTRKDGLGVYCSACHQEYAHTHYQANREKQLTAHAARRRNNPDAFRARRKRVYERDRPAAIKRAAEYAARHPDRVRESKAKWKKNNPLRVSEHTRRRTARITAATIEQVDYNVIWQRDGGICHICRGLVAPDDVHFDHVVPLSRGGPHTYGNIKVAHASCNLKKGPRPI